MLSERDRELVGIGASLAAGCQPCTNFHLRAARIAGASDAEVSQAVDDALRVRRHATEVMAQIAGESSNKVVSDAFGFQDKPLIGELVSISAAYAANSVTDLESHLTAARKLGATAGEILTAIKIACAVKDTAAKKVQEAAAQATGAAPAQTESCCNSSELESPLPQDTATTARAPVNADGGPQCGCRG